MLQINTVMLGELTSPGVCHSRVQQNTSGLPNVSTSMRGDPMLQINTVHHFFSCHFIWSDIYILLGIIHTLRTIVLSQTFLHT